MVSFDAENVTPKIRQDMQVYLKDPEYNETRASKASRAAGPLVKWATAVRAAISSSKESDIVVKPRLWMLFLKTITCSRIYFIIFILSLFLPPLVLTAYPLSDRGVCAHHAQH